MLYDESSNGRPRNAWQEALKKPFRHAVDTQRERIRDLHEQLSDPALLDQFPGRTQPRIYTFRWPLNLITARRNGAVGHEGRADVVDLSDFRLPLHDNLKTSRDSAFVLKRWKLSSFVSLTFNADPGFVANPAAVINPIPVGDIFDPVFTGNGGALQCNYHFSHPLIDKRTVICLDFELFDKKRNKRLHEGALPAQVFTAGNFAIKEVPFPVRFDPDSELELRMRPLEVRVGNILDTDQAFDAAQFRAWVQLSLCGYQLFEV